MGRSRNHPKLLSALLLGASCWVVGCGDASQSPSATAGGGGSSADGSGAEASAALTSSADPDAESSAAVSTRSSEPADQSGLKAIPSKPVARYKVGDRVVRITREELDERLREFKAFHLIFFPTDPDPKPGAYWPFLLGHVEAELAGIVVTEKDIEAKIKWAFPEEVDRDYVQQVLDFNEVSMETFRTYVSMLVSREKLTSVYSEHPFVLADRVYEMYDKMDTVYSIEYLAYSHADFLDQLANDVPEGKKVDEALKLARAEAKATKDRMIEHVRGVNSEKLATMTADFSQSIDEKISQEETKARAENPEITEAALKQVLNPLQREKARNERLTRRKLNLPMGHVGFEHVVQVEELTTRPLNDFRFDYVSIAENTNSPTAGIQVAPGTEVTELDMRNYLLMNTTLARTNVGEVSGIFVDPIQGMAYIIKTTAKTRPDPKAISPLLYRQAEKIVADHENSRLSQTINFFHLNQRFSLRTEVGSQPRVQMKTGTPPNQKGR